MIMRGKIWIFLSHHDSWVRLKDNTQKVTSRKQNLFRLPMSSHRRRCRMLVGVYRLFYFCFLRAHSLERSTYVLGFAEEKTSIEINGLKQNKKHIYVNVKENEN